MCPQDFGVIFQFFLFVLNYFIFLFTCLKLIINYHFKKYSIFNLTILNSIFIVSGYTIVSWSCVWGTLLCLGLVSVQTFFIFYFLLFISHH